MNVNETASLLGVPIELLENSDFFIEAHITNGLK